MSSVPPRPLSTPELTTPRPLHEAHEVLTHLARLRERAGRRQTRGLSDDELRPFLSDPDLLAATREAVAAASRLQGTEAELMRADEADAIARARAGFLSFYADEAVQPYLTLAARGAWIVTLHGAAVLDCGGYGMLAFGHAPAPVMEALSRPHPMANIMTPHLSQQRLQRALRDEIGHTREDGCPFGRFLCMNSGSEAMSVVARIVDIHTHHMTRADGPRAGARPVAISMENSFHGRTLGPAAWSHSTLSTYRAHLQSFQDRDSVWAVPANDAEALAAAFERARREDVFVQAVILEPVQGEGAPGRALQRGYYDRARELTRAHGALLVVDSIQAGLRAHGVLSIVDYPGFQDAAAPDMECWSKAINAGQFPVSVLGLEASAAARFVTGVYGNTMTTNPRGLEVVSTVLRMMTPEVRENIVRQGAAFRADLEALARELPEVVEEVIGTGLLFSMELSPARCRVVGVGSAEDACRRRGVNVIHGGRNALRFTPSFRTGDEERRLVVRVLREVLTALRDRTEPG